MLLWSATTTRVQSILHTQNHQRMLGSEETFQSSHTLSQFESQWAGTELCLSLVSFWPVLKLNLSPHASVHTKCTHPSHTHTPTPPSESQDE